MHKKTEGIGEVVRVDANLEGELKTPALAVRNWERDSTQPWRGRPGSICLRADTHDGLAKDLRCCNQPALANICDVTSLRR